MLVALPRRICCSLVCKAKRKAARPVESMLTPINLPGKDLDKSSLTAINPACGPPKPSGTPNLCALPTAISTPKDPGSSIKVNANKSVVVTTTNPLTLDLATKSFISLICPELDGYEMSTPKAFESIL